MTKLNQKIISLWKYYFNNKFIIFFVVGVSAFLVDISVLFLQRDLLKFDPEINLLTLDNFVVNLYIANVIAVIAALTFGFFLNRFWTFKETAGKAKHQIWQYYFVSIFNLLINNLIYGTLVPLGVHPFMAKVFATFVQMFTSFALYKLVVFKV